MTAHAQPARILVPSSFLAPILAPILDPDVQAPKIIGKYCWHLNFWSYFLAAGNWNI